ncbi:O-methyltransferase [Gelidibacter maritimus]|uniref:Class I SAM-dependent methyltransferase n=1 Tax=Gelidibacter maritimus TaxID=2761487 RepID=A0A7W2M4S0_9FLAO|nr:class I SAM-dependent methyltransferase [Gelidibacter maritimus]MBA6152719.1 class I SAM-dependent methyltransferase [Gelidibacter maritimus]
MHQLLSYIKFLLKSKNQHGVHSPFVYDLVTTCFYDRKKHTEYQAIAAYRSELLQNPKKIRITDFGSGSKIFKSDERAVNAIARTSGTTLKNTKLLFRIVRYFQSPSILELGTNLGIATHAMALANPKASITTIEGCSEILNVANQQFSNKRISNVTTIQGDFTSKIQELTQDKWDLIFFDGHHSKEATLRYFEILLSKAHNDSVFIFDDIYWSKGMTEAWQIIKAHPKVTVTVDTFNWGIVFFRKEQAEEHFKIRV